jgi:hypothetical protein
MPLAAIDVSPRAPVLPKPQLGRLYPAFANAKLGKTVINFSGLVAVGVAVHPCLNRVAVLGASELT